MHILIVEDDVRVRALLRELVEPYCDIVTECSNGREAVDMYDSAAPDLVLMDVRMPELDGIEATRRIVRRHAGARLVIVTEYNSAFYRSNAAEAGAVGFFAKDNLLELQKYVVAFRSNLHRN